jgi:hypothetical protein
MTEIV